MVQSVTPLILLSTPATGSAPLVRRTGIVRPGPGRAVADGTGAFHPLGLTWMWALYGQKFERDRIKAHLDFLAPYGYDYVRILGEVGWPGETIDPAWPDYQDILGSFIDDAWTIAGLRTQITLMGGGTNTDPMRLAEQVASVIWSRAEKVLALEVGNESFQNGPSTDDLVRVARYLRGTTAHLVALSAPIPGDLASTDAMVVAARDAGANLFTMHTDRGEHDHKWRQVRQAWDFKSLPFVVSANEPPGPNSSVGTNDSPLQLAMMRVTGALAGAALHVLHIGDMVYGRDMPDRNRKANLWDVDNIDAILRAVRGVDPLLPQGVENWPKYNNAWSGHPLTVDAFWSDGDGDHGVNRNYAATSGDQILVALDGVKSYVVNTAQRAMTVEAVDPLTGAAVATASLAPGQTWRLDGREDTMTAYVVRTVPS